MYFYDRFKIVNVPTLTYEMIVYFAQCHQCTLAEAARRLFFSITLSFWSDPSAFDCYPETIKVSK